MYKRLVLNFQFLNRLKGRRFRRIVNKKGMEQGHYVSIAKNGSGFETIIPKTERLDED